MISRLGFVPTRSKTTISTKLQKTNEVTIVIPVKNNQVGIDLFLKQFFATHSPDTFPAEIIIVDNNSFPAIKVSNENLPFPVTLLKCTRPGPASARNEGSKQVKTDWILFTDSDCVPTSTMLSGYIDAQNGSLAYAGHIVSYRQDVISRYYEQQEILLPPKVYERPYEPRPDYVITANCLVWRNAFETVGGFNEQITIAGGEDIDLGFKLLNIGQLSYAFGSVARHNFGDGLRDFRRRFKRYGYGNKIIARLYGLDLTPLSFKPNKRTLINYVLAYMQYFWLKSGYKKGKIEQLSSYS